MLQGSTYLDVRFDTLLNPTLNLAGAGVIAEKSTKETVDLLRQRQLQLGMLQSAGLRCITQMTTNSLSCLMQLELLKWCAHCMQRPKSLPSIGNNLQYLIGSRQALLHHRKPHCSLLQIWSRFLTSGNHMMNICMDNRKLAHHPSI